MVSCTSLVVFLFIETLLTLEPLIASNCYNHLLSAVPSIILFFVHSVCLWNSLPADLVHSSSIRTLKSKLRCIYMFVLSACLLVCLFPILLSKSLILALGYGTDCTFHLYDIDQFHLKKKNTYMLVGWSCEKLSCKSVCYLLLATEHRYRCAIPTLAQS